MFIYSCQQKERSSKITQKIAILKNIIVELKWT